MNSSRLANRTKGLCPDKVERSLPKVQSLLSPLPAWAQEDFRPLPPICAQKLLSLGLGPAVPDSLWPFRLRNRVTAHSERGKGKVEGGEKKREEGEEGSL